MEYRNRSHYVVALMICVLAAFFCAEVQGETVTVDADGPGDYPTIQAAIDDANDGDRVVVLPGTYWENINFGGKNIVLSCTDSTDPEVVAATIIDGNDLGPTVAFAGSETNDCRIEGLTITGGHGDDGPQTSGGGIAGHKTHAHILRCRIVDNISDEEGGGIGECYGTMEQCYIARNIARAGGGLYRSYGTVDGCTIVENRAYGSAVLYYRKLVNCVIARNFGPTLHPLNHTIRGAGTVINCTICDNTGCGLAMMGRGTLIVKNSIMWNNTGGDFQFECGGFCGGIPDGEIMFNVLEKEFSWDWLTVAGTIITDPCFVDPENGDFHLKSQGGRWDSASELWVIDEVTSGCIDAGHPLSPIGQEPFPNGGRINIGAHGGTSQASKSYFGGPPCEVIVAGDVNGDCRVDFADFYFVCMNWLRHESS